MHVVMKLCFKQKDTQDVYKNFPLNICHTLPSNHRCTLTRLPVHLVYLLYMNISMYFWFCFAISTIRAKYIM